MSEIKIETTVPEIIAIFNVSNKEIHIAINGMGIRKKGLISDEYVENSNNESRN